MLEAQYFGVAGVSLLLIAFALNLIKWLSQSHPAYLIMNLVGAGLAAVYALETGAIPFVVLEAVWAVFALVRLIQLLRRPVRN